MYVTLREVLAEANQLNMAVGAFNTITSRCARRLSVSRLACTPP